MKTVRVGDVAEQLRGVTFSKVDAIPSPREGYVAVLTAGNLQDGQLITSDLTYVPAGKVSAKQQVRRHDVVICASSGSLSVVGKAAQSDGSFAGGFGAFLKVLRPGPEVDPRYFAHYFQTQAYRRTVSSLAAGANINNLKNEHLNELLLPLPPLPEQRRIAAILDHADSLRAKRRQGVSYFDSLTKSVFNDMFGRAAWPTEKLGDRLQFLTSGSRGWAKYYAPGGDKFIRIQNVKGGYLNQSDMAFVAAPDTAEARRTEVRAGDVLLSITADLGRTAVVPDGLGRAFINQHLAVLRAPSIAPRYLADFLESPKGQREVLGKDRGATKAGLNFDDVRSVALPIPPMNMQAAYVERVERINAQRANVLLGIEAVDSLFQSLQSRAFRGEL